MSYYNTEYRMTELNKILAANEEYSEDFRHGGCHISPQGKLQYSHAWMQG
jgi:hypothetical protein